MLVLATSFGGTTYAWGSWQIIGLLVGGVAVLGVFVLIETAGGRADPAAAAVPVRGSSPTAAR